MAGFITMATAAIPSNGRPLSLPLLPLFTDLRTRVNSEGKFVYIKYHFLATHGQKQFTEPEAIMTSGENPDYAKQQLWEAIEKGEEITWKANVQIMQPEEADANKLGFDPFDVTKVWPRDQFPMHEFGNLVLNKNPENYHRDVEQAAFSPGSLVPGIEDSPDPLLQFRMFFYRDAQYHRIGVNLHQIPVNCPFMAGQYASLNFDGPMRADANHAGNKQYVPNSFKNTFRPDVAEAPYSVSDNVVSRKSHYAHEGKKSEYAQATELYRRVMSDTAREHTHQNTAKMLAKVTYPIIQVSRLPSVSTQVSRVGSRPLMVIVEEISRADLQHRARVPQSGIRPPSEERLSLHGGRGVGEGRSYFLQGAKIQAW